MVELVLIFGIIISVVLSVIAFFLMAIWRAILGSSGVNIRIASNMVIMDKTLNKLSGSLDKNSSKQDEVAKQLRELDRHLDKE